jgi:hypothetical protein
MMGGARGASSPKPPILDSNKISLRVKPVRVRESEIETVVEDRKKKNERRYGTTANKQEKKKGVEIMYSVQGRQG